MSLPKSIEKELELPVSFTLDGEKMVTLKEFLTSEKDNSIPIRNLSQDQLAKITIERIKQKPEICLAMVEKE